MCEPRKGEPYTGRLTANGNIAFEGTIFGSSSDWASKIAGNSRNGWRDVSARGRPLSEFRERYEEGFRGPQQKVPKKPEESERIPDGGNEITPPVSNVSSITGELLNVIQLLSPVAFEKLIGEYLVAKGFSDIEVTGRANDGGIDGHCRIPLIDVNVAFQAKRYQTGNNVGIDPVQRLIGSMGQNYDRGIFITSSDFTATAKGWVEEKHSPVVLISGQTFVTQLFELELGITVVPLVKYEINDLFFTSLDN